MNRYWSETHKKLISERIRQAKENNPRPFAVFDADNTIWKHDLVESLIAWMSAAEILEVEHLDSAILPYPLRADDTVLSYYMYLCGIDHAVGYLFASQIFAGFSLRELRTQVDAMMSSLEPILAPMPDGQLLVQIPKIFPAQKELIHYLQNQGVEVWIVSASLEELVRMVASDEQYGLQLPPERVIGVNLMMSSPRGHVTVGALERREGRRGTAYYFSEQRMEYILSTIPWTPLTWYGGKLAAILEWIDPAQKPILVAGDSPNDFIMQFHVAANRGGIRLRIHRNDEHKRAWERQCDKQEQGDVHQSPSMGWIHVTSSMLGIPEKGEAE